MVGKQFMIWLCSDLANVDGTKACNTYIQTCIKTQMNSLPTNSPRHETGATLQMSFAKYLIMQQRIWPSGFYTVH